MSNKYQVLLMPGEGIGSEIIQQGERVLRAVAEKYNIDVEFTEHLIGIPQHELSGRYLSEETEQLCKELMTNPNAGILFGAVSGEPIGILRKDYDLFANLRPIRAFEKIATASPLRPERLAGVDMLIVRELVSGIYYGAYAEGDDEHGHWAKQEMYYHETEVRRITKVALEQANKRRKLVHLVHKGNVLIEIFDIWKRVLKEEAANYPDVEVQDILVDNMAMQMVLRPNTFDVLLSTNLFGDILSDLGAGVIGSIGLLPSASLNGHGFGLFESVGGTAPDIAGQQKANPLSTILSAAMLCRQTLDSEEAAQAIENAVDKVLSTHRTGDILEDGYQLVSTEEMGSLIVEAL